MPIGDLILRIKQQVTGEGDVREALDDVRQGIDQNKQATEEAAETSRRASDSDLENLAKKLGALQLIKETLQEIINFESQSRAIALGQAGEVQEARQVQTGLRLESVSDADAIRRSLNARGLSETTIRGFFDPIQEYVAAASLDPDDVTANRNRERLGQFFDLDAISQGGAANLDLLLGQVAGLTPQQQSFLPAVGVSVNDVQELASYAQDYTAGGGLAGLRALYGGSLITEDRAQATFGAAASASAYGAYEDRLDAVRAGIIDPSNLAQRSLQYPFGAFAGRQARGFIEGVEGLTFDVPGYQGPAALEAGGALRQVTVNIDGRPIVALTNRAAEEGGLSGFDQYDFGN